MCRNFYPRSPCGERLIIKIRFLFRLSFLSTLSLRRATRVLDGSRSSIEISIHALLAESDSFGLFGVDKVSISIHALLAESDMSGLRHKCAIFYFYPRSPCGERPVLAVLLMFSLISIHALLAESDGRSWRKQSNHHKFLSTLSLRRATTTTITICTASRFLSTLSLRRATRAY